MTTQHDEAQAWARAWPQANRLARFLDEHGVDRAEYAAGRVSLDISPILDPTTGQIITDEWDQFGDALMPLPPLPEGLRQP